MIAADAVELRTNLRQVLIHIRQKEVSLFTDQFGVLASASTFLATLGFGALTMSTNFLEKGERGHEFCSDLVGCDVKGNRGQGLLFNNEAAIFVFFALTSASIFSNFVVVFVSVYCLIFGPELAIRGAQKEQQRAIKGMYEERRFALRFFWLGCFLIVSAAAALGWLKYPERTAITMTVVFVVLLISSVYYVTAFLTPLFAYTDAEGLDTSYYEKPPPPPPTDDITKSALLNVDGSTRHGLLSGAVLRIFDLEGLLVDAIDLSDAKFHLLDEAFQLECAGRHLRLAGADFAETHAWIQAIIANIPNIDFLDDFDDEGADEEKRTAPRHKRPAILFRSRFVPPTLPSRLWSTVQPQQASSEAAASSPPASERQEPSVDSTSGSSGPVADESKAVSAPSSNSQTAKSDLPH